MHYARTLEHWLARFEKSADRVTEMFGLEFVRALAAVLAGSIAGFRGGHHAAFSSVIRRLRMPVDSRPREIISTQTQQSSEKALKWMHATS